MLNKSMWCGVLAVAGLFSMAAAEIRWDDGYGPNSDWNRSNNWYPNTVPGPGDDIYFDDTRVSTGQTIDLNGNQTVYGSLTFSNKVSVAYTLNNNILTLGGTVTKHGAGSVTVNSGLALGGNRVFDILGSGGFNANGVISGTGNSLTKSGSGTMTIGGTGANTYSGDTIVNGGTLALSKSAGVNAIAGNVTVGDGIGGAGADVLKLLASDQISDSAAVTVGSSGRFDLNGFDERIAALSGANSAAQVTLGAGDLTVGDSTSSTFAGAISGSGGLVKKGSGTLTLSGANTFTGSLTIDDGGVLRVEGAQSTVDAFLTSSLVGTIGGTGGRLAIAYSNAAITNNFSKAPSVGTNVKLGFDRVGDGTVVYTVGTTAHDMAKWGGLVIQGGRVELAADQSLTGGAGATTLEMQGGTLSLAGGSPSGGKTLTIEGDATLSGGTLDGGPGGGSRGRLVTGGDIISDGTTLQNSPDITMNPDSGTVEIRGSTPLTGVGTLTKTGAGTVEVNQELGAQSVIINQGTLLLGGNERIDNFTAITLAGGELHTGGFDETVFTLTLTGASTIDLGNGDSVLKFADSWYLPWSGTITVENWSGSLLGGGGDQLIFGNSNYSISGAQLGKITFLDPLGPGSGVFAAGILPTGEIVPIPEPTAVAALLGLVGLVAFREWRDRRKP